MSAGVDGADVIIDGKRVAVTPATLPALSQGVHQLEVRSGSGVVKRTLRIRAGRTTYVEVGLDDGKR